jgi:hydroxymethylpyrimidine/phosphomethylpyrimidine kinase
VAPRFVVAHLDAVLTDPTPVAAKMEALTRAALVAAVASRAASFGFPLVVDPVMISKQGKLLLGADGPRS